MSSRRRAQYGSINQGYNARLAPRSTVRDTSSQAFTGTHTYYGGAVESDTKISDIDHPETRVRLNSGEAVILGGSSWDDSGAGDPSRQRQRARNPSADHSAAASSDAYLAAKIPKRMTSAPSEWGPAFWFSIHNATMFYPVKPTSQEEKEFVNFVSGLPSMIACITCRENARLYIENNKENIKRSAVSREKVFQFFVDFHNHVNQSNGKSPLTYSKVFSLYTEGF
jgi:hypothetical protein